MALSPPQQAALTRAVGSPVRWNVPLATLTSFRVGGPADALVTLLTVEELQPLLKILDEYGLAWKLLGRGSNILADDDGFRGVIVVLGGQFKYIVRQASFSGERMTVSVGPAVTLPQLADWCCEQSLAGIEFGAGIPGSVGGAVAMNAGAWGGDMAGIVSAVALVSADSAVQLTGEQLRFSYRRFDSLSDSRGRAVISGVELQLEPGERQAIRARMHRLMDERRLKQPQGQPSGGSVFKNPVSASAGLLIDQAGLKGLRIGDAEISEKHANFIVNRGKATAADIRALIDEARRRVEESTGILLEPEIELL